jgi:hypothetical protein
MDTPKNHYKLELPAAESPWILILPNFWNSDLLLVGAEISNF